MAGKSVSVDDLVGKVLQGTCGWSDSSIVKCGRFYPGSVKTTEDRLLHYSRVFPCVECDTSNYAIPSPAVVEKWLKCVPSGFKFHFKAFGFFTRKSISLSALPHVVRDELPTSIVNGQTSITWEELTEVQKQKLWDRYNSALLPAYQKNKLGVVVFQFHLGFHPTDVNKKHIIECRKFLDVRYPMAVEFRSRVWFSAENLPASLDWLKQHNIGLVVADELQTELYVDKSNSSDHQKDSGRGGVVPIVMALGSCDFAYIRVHRRVGKHRILGEEEIKSWGERLRSPELQSSIRGPIYFMWGTDHEDQPIINSKNLTKEIGTLAYNWKKKISNSGLLRFCSKVHTAQGDPLKESSVSERKIVEDEGEGFFHTDSTEDDKIPGTETDSPRVTQDREDSESLVDKSGNSPPFLTEEPKLSLSGSSTKRTSSSAGLISPKKKHASGNLKPKFATPNNQRMISDFFRK